MSQVQAVRSRRASPATQADETSEIEDIVVFEQEETLLEQPLSELPLSELPHSFSIWGLLRRSAINLFLPFINGIMLGFGEIFAHEVGFRYGFVGARVWRPRDTPRSVPRSTQPRPAYL